MTSMSPASGSRMTNPLSNEIGSSNCYPSVNNPGPVDTRLNSSRTVQNSGCVPRPMSTSPPPPSMSSIMQESIISNDHMDSSISSSVISNNSLSTMSNVNGSGLRQRNTTSHVKTSTIPEMPRALKRFDIYNKVHDDYSVKTKSGGTLSLVVYLGMAILIMGELHQYWSPIETDHIVVDVTLDQKLPIGLNITFPELRCDEVSVDTVDSAGDNQIDIATGDLNKRAVGHDLQYREPYKASPGECITCYSADGWAPSGCCNTCGELIEAYMHAGLAYNPIIQNAIQCKDEPGCNIEGDVRVSKVAGNVHVALGKSTIRQGRHVHEFSSRDVTKGFNTSHIINRLQFGPRFNGKVGSPLEGTQKMVHSGAFMFHYYVKLIPTTFLDDREPDIVRYTHQYSSTEASRNILVNKEHLLGLPGVFIVYEFSPFLIKKTLHHTPVSHLITSLFVILGGIVSIAGMLDKVVFAVFKKLKITRGVPPLF